MPWNRGSITSPPAITPAGWTRRQGAFILRGRDPNKDQSYFLSLMRPDQIARAVFPLGDLLKPEVRVLAEKYGLPTARKKDSQGICFIGQVKMSDFLRHYLPDKPGKIRGHGRPDARHAQRPASVHHGPEERARRRLPAGGSRLCGGGKGCPAQPPDSGIRRRVHAGIVRVPRRGRRHFQYARLPCRPASWPSPATGPRAEWASCEYLEEGKVRLGFDTPSGPWPWDRSAPFTTEASCSGAAFLNP